MTTYLPTPAEFLAESTPDEDDVAFSPGWRTPVLLPPDPLVSIAESLAALTELVRTAASGEESSEVTDLQQRLQVLEHTNDELLDECGVSQARITEALELLKKSTSKLAIAVRDVLDPATEPEPAEVAEEDEPHAFVTEDGVDCCRLCGRHEHDGQGIHGTDAPGSEAIEQPGPEADVWAWREYARLHGLDAHELNRNQIRTALGIPQPVGEPQ